MKIYNNIIKRVGIMAILALAASGFAAGKPAPASLSPEGKILEEQYSKMQADLRESIKRLEPKVDEKKKAEFTKQLGALGNVPSVTKTVMRNEVEVKYGPENPAFVEKQKEVLTAARAVMKDIDAFLVGEKGAGHDGQVCTPDPCHPEPVGRVCAKGRRRKSADR